MLAIATTESCPVPCKRLALEVVVSLCEGAPTHGRRMKKNNFVEHVLSVCLSMMCEHTEDPGWEAREEIDQGDDDDDTTNRGMGEEALARLAEVKFSPSGYYCMVACVLPADGCGPPSTLWARTCLLHSYQLA